MPCDPHVTSVISPLPHATVTGRQLQLPPVDARGAFACRRVLPTILKHGLLSSKNFVFLATHPVIHSAHLKLTMATKNSHFKARSSEA